MGGMPGGCDLWAVVAFKVGAAGIGVGRPRDRHECAEHEEATTSLSCSRTTPLLRISASNSVAFISSPFSIFFARARLLDV